LICGSYHFYGHPHDQTAKPGATGSKFSGYADIKGHYQHAKFGCHVNFTKLHGRIAKQLRQCLTKGNVPEWMVLGRTNLAMKDETEGREVESYRPRACLPVSYNFQAAHGYHC